MESAIRTICEPIFDKPLKDISFGVVLLRLFEALRRFDARIQPQLILLQKTLFNVEGLGRQLYPDLDVWKTANPVLREWLEEKRNPVNVARRMWAQMPELLIALEAAPTALRNLIVAAAEPKPSTATFASDAHRVAAVSVVVTRPGQRANTTAAALALLAGVVALGVERVPAALGWTLAAVGAVWLLAAAMNARRG
jgi:ubiquinone biosynthesis protein